MCTLCFLINGDGVPSYRTKLFHDSSCVHSVSLAALLLLNVVAPIPQVGLGTRIDTGLSQVNSRLEVMECALRVDPVISEYFSLHVTRMRRDLEPVSINIC